MKITQEVRKLAARQDAEAETVVAAEPALVDAEAGMAQKSAEFLDGGSELYVGAGGREHD